MLNVFLVAALASGETLHDFSREDATQFVCVNDTVMGGKSSSKVEALDGGILRFSGTVSLENNGGFTSFRARETEYEIGASEGLSIRVKGDGRKYILSLDLSGIPIPAGGYWQPFETKKGEWIEVRLPYDRFVPTSFGRELDGLAKVTPERIVGLTIYLYDKKAGPFSADFDWIKTYGAAASSQTEKAMADDVGLLPETCSTLATLLAKTELDAAVAKLDGFTLFAPTDAAFQKLPKNVVTALLRPENASALKKVLLHHVVAAPVTAWNAAALKSADVLDGGQVAIERTDEGLRVGGALVVTADRLRGKGVIHVVDSVIVPSDLALATTPSDPSSVFAAAIARGVPLFNDGNVAACAAVYRTAIEAVIALGGASLDSQRLEELTSALAKAEHESDRAASWTLRRAMDAVIANT